MKRDQAKAEKEFIDKHLNMIYKFKIGTESITLELTHKDDNKGRWSCDIIQGDTGAGGMWGGEFDSMDEYIKSCESHYRYCFAFFKGKDQGVSVGGSNLGGFSIAACIHDSVDS